MATILYFPEDDFTPPKFNWLTWARAEISSSAAHARAVAEGRSRRVEAITGDPSDADGFLPAKQTDTANEAAGTPGRILSATADVSTRPGCGEVNWKLFGRILKIRQMEIKIEPLVEINREWARVVEARVAKELYG